MMVEFVALAPNQPFRNAVLRSAPVESVIGGYIPNQLVPGEVVSLWPNEDQKAMVRQVYDEFVRMLTAHGWVSQGRCGSSWYNERFQRPVKR